MKRRQPLQEKATLFDRFAVALLSGLLSFISSLVIWFLIVIAMNFEGPYIFSSFKLVIGFTVIMALLGFFMLENFLARLLGRLWQFIFEYLKD